MTKITQSQPSNSVNSNFLDETKNFLDETKRAQVDRLARLSISVSRDYEPSEAIPAANSSRMPPLFARASARSRGSALRSSCARAARLYAAPKLEQFYFEFLEFHTQRLDLLRRVFEMLGLTVIPSGPQAALSISAEARPIADSSARCGP
jgi:hypothetical protein